MVDLPPKYFSSTEVFDTFFFADRLYQGEMRRLPVVDYLHFLHLSRDDAVVEVMKLRSLLAQQPVDVVERAVECALSQYGWRPHLMACMAVADGFRGGDVIPALWWCIRNRSWVVPQLVATAAYADSAFVGKALDLIGSAPSNTQLVVTLASMLKSRFSFVFEEGGRLAMIVEEATLADQKSLDPDPARFSLPWLDRLREIFG